MIIYVFKGMVCACSGITTAFIWFNQNIYYGFPAASIFFLGMFWFVSVYKKWEHMSNFHSDVGNKLCECVKDLEIPAKTSQVDH